MPAAVSDLQSGFRTTLITNPNELREVIAIGLGKLTDKAIEGPALWTAKIRDEKVAAWQVYEDTVDNRQRLHINDE